LFGFLLNKGLDITQLDKLDSSPLHIAAKYGNWDIIEQFMKDTVDVDARTAYLTTPLHYCASASVSSSTVGRMGVIQGLLKLGADLNAMDRDGETAMHYAASSGYSDIIEVLAEQGADINIKSFYL